MTATRRDAELVKDQSQSRTGRSWMLKPGAFGAMTAILDVLSQRRLKPSGHNGLTDDWRHRCRQEGK